MLKKIGYFLILIFFLFSVFFFDHKKPDTYVKIGGQTVKVRLAENAKEQEKGLSGSKTLAPDEGMLFIFQTPGKYYFWMKDMQFPIDIIWIGEDHKVTYIKENARPETPEETFASTAPSKFVLEVVSGFSEKNKLKIGDTVEIFN